MTKHAIFHIRLKYFIVSGFIDDYLLINDVQCSYTCSSLGLQRSVYERVAVSREGLRYF